MVLFLFFIFLILKKKESQILQFLFLMMRYVMNETLSFLITVLRPSIVIIYHMYVVYVYESVSPPAIDTR